VPLLPAEAKFLVFLLSLSIQAVLPAATAEWLLGIMLLDFILYANVEEISLISPYIP
jgi:hypothetical protein